MSGDAGALSPLEHRPLPILWIVGSALSALQVHWRDLLRAMFVPVLLLEACLIASTALHEVNETLSIGLFHARMLAFPLFAVRWHRLVLRDEAVERIVPPFDRTLFVYTAWAAAGYAAIEIRDAASTWLAENGHNTLDILLGLAVLQLVFSVAFLRLEFVLPAAAVGDPTGLSRAWTLGRGNTWALFFVGILTTIVIAFPFLPLFVIYDEPSVLLTRHLYGDDVVAMLVARFVQAVLWMTVVSFQTGTISYAYRYLTTDEVAAYPPLPRLPD